MKRQFLYSSMWFHRLLLGVVGGMAMALLLTGPTVALSQGVTRKIGEIERLDPAFDELIAPDTYIEKLSEGFAWAEGPAWNRQEGYLIFSDVQNNLVSRWDEKKGLTLFLQPSGYTGKKQLEHPQGSNGLVYDPQGRLILCQHGDRRIARLEGKRFVTVVDKYRGKRLNSPNDAVYKMNGDLYFTDPPYGLAEGEDDAERDLDFCGVYRLDKQRKLTLLTLEMTRPNGIAFSPDEKLLYVAQSDPDEPIIKVFDVKEDGTTMRGRVFFDATDLAKDKNNLGLPDGLKVDEKGNLFATGPGGVLVLSPDGKHLGTLRTGVATANCAWGGNGSTLYITAHTYLLRIKTTTRGAGF
ncbi:MAG TPA: SMP-30/gluconolactonase/LRE family protein [Pirellulales bacterium]|nr:SMP-30/gluconolactonase/LRE family protein [Pirellulales bacterium]